MVVQRACTVAVYNINIGSQGSRRSYLGSKHFAYCNPCMYVCALAARVNKIDSNTTTRNTAINMKVADDGENNNA